MNKLSEKWNKRFLDICRQVATWSNDPNTKVAAVIVGPHKEIRSTGYNGLPRGVNDDITSRYNKPQKYLWTEHAERNAIYNASRIGVSTLECIIYTSMYPCAECARAIIQAGITQVITCDDSLKKNEKWRESFEIAEKMFAESKIEVIVYNMA